MLSKRNKENIRQYNTTIGRTRGGCYPRETRETTGSIVQSQVEQEEDAYPRETRETSVSIIQLQVEQEQISIQEEQEKVNSVQPLNA